MTLAGIELRYLVNEISKKTLDYYVSNIYGITKDSILFKLHHPQKEDVLLMFSTFGLWTSNVKIKQIEPNKLIRRLRSDLLRLKLTKIEQIGAERIAYLKFSGFDKEFVLVGEFFGDGNIIICNNEMKILALLHSIDVRHRKLRVGLQYTPPPENSVNILNLSKSSLDGITSSTLPVSKWIGRTLGLPTKYVEYICKISNLDSKTIGKEISAESIEKIYDSVIQTTNKVVNGNHQPVIINNEKKFDVYPIKLDDNEDHTDVSSFMDGLDNLFTKNIIDTGTSLQSNKNKKIIEEFENKLQEQTKAVSIVKEKSSSIAAVAKLLFDITAKGISNINDPKIQDTLKKTNSEIVKAKGLTFVKINDEKIKINPNATIPAIASKLFDESKKQKSAISSIEKLKKKTEEKLQKLKTQAEASDELVTYREIKKKNWFERYRWFYTSDGVLAIGGRDASSNSAVIRKHLEKNDKVFHADIFGSPFFILKSDEETIPFASLNEVSQATVCFSRAWREAMSGLNAFWINPDQVKKAAPSGQFLAKGSFVIEGKRNLVKISELQLAVGLFKKGDDYLLTCGPLAPIRKNCVCYVIIEPTGMEMVDVAKKIKSKFLEIKEDVAKSFSIDDFVRILPAGKSHLVESSLGEQTFE